MGYEDWERRRKGIRERLNTSEKAISSVVVVDKGQSTVAAAATPVTAAAAAMCD